MNQVPTYPQASQSASLRGPRLGLGLGNIGVPLLAGPGIKLAGMIGSTSADHSSHSSSAYIDGYADGMQDEYADFLDTGGVDF